MFSALVQMKVSDPNSRPYGTSCAASCAGQRMFHADGEVATANAAKKHGLHMELSQVEILKIA